MRTIDSQRLQLVLRLATCALILKVTTDVILSYREYVPPSFESDFLRGREAYFWGGYHRAFYAHIASGPVALILGMIQLSDRFRLRFSTWHRILGRVQAACVLLLITPSGLWMAFYAETGAIAGAGFATLAVATALCAWLGWRSIMKRRFAEHRRWMLRCYLLLCSAIVLRLLGGIFTVTGIAAEWTYPLAAWASWLLPWGVFELLRCGTRPSALRFGHLTRSTY